MFSTLKALTIPEGKVKKIEVNGVVLWKEPAGIKNWLEYAINTDGTIFNGVGYQKGCRISSSGALKDASYGSVTGFIPTKANDTILFKDKSNLIKWNDSSASLCQSVAYYDSKFKFIGSFTLQPAYYGICNTQNSVFSGGISNGEGMITLHVLDNANIAYIRLGVSTNHSDGTGIEGLIVTVNEEIVD